MEDSLRQRQYTYNSTANLVLTSENRRRDVGPSSEVESLTAKKDARSIMKEMGSRVSFSKPTDGAAEAKKKRKDRDEKEEDDQIIRKKADVSMSVLSTEVDTFYRPKTRETKLAYEVLLNFIQEEMGGQPHDVLRSAADEILAVLKDDALKDAERKREVEELFGRGSKAPIEPSRFASLVNIGKNITDYKGTTTEASTSDSSALDDQLGVPVVFEDEDDRAEAGDEDEDEEDGDEDLDAELDVQDEKDEDEEAESSSSSGDAMNVEDDSSSSSSSSSSSRASTIRSSGSKSSAATAASTVSSTGDLDARSIDAYWLQRELSTYYKDALVSQRMSDDVFGVLSNPGVDGRQCENKLVALLEHDKFDLIKRLLKNRWKIVYAIRYARAKDDAERAELADEMQGSAQLAPIWQQLTRTAGKDKASSASASSSTAAPGRKGAIGSASGPVATPKSAAAAAASAIKGKSILDLESLSFSQGGHFMSNQNCKLPDGTYTVDKKGYQEVHVPALKPAELSPLEKLVEIASLPDWAQPAFTGMRTLNRVQSRLYQTALLSAENLLLCAPTGAGKTNVAMLTMLREIGLHRSEDGSINKDAFKIVYVAPMKSLVREMVANFSQRLEPYGLTVKELSGDQQLTKQQISETQVIVTTPEKWDIITRKSGDRTYTQFVRLVIIDEIHLLHDDRGPVLESIVARTVRQIESTQEMIRLVGLSATLPNYEDVATFLRVDPAKGLYFFDNSFRPCPLQQVYVGITEKKAFKRFQMMNEIAYDKVMEQAANKQQVLVFVHSRKDTAATAKAIRDMAQANDTLHKLMREDSQSSAILADQAEGVKHPDLKDLLPYGFAIHHAGMNRNDRALVEDLFAAGHIQVLVCTATLAWGVNLPAHAVIIKGTQVYSPEKGKWTELSPQDVLQMFGRAGRPQYDKFGEGIIITSRTELYFYLSLLNQQLPIESQYMSKLADNLNAEIVLGTVQNVKEAVDWLGYTYLYVRMLRSPALYGISAGAAADDPLLTQRRADLIHTAASLLDKTNLVKYDRKSGAFQVTDLGRVASHYYISHTSMATYNDYLKPNMSDIELFRVFSLSGEFKYISVREEEKMELGKLLDKVPIPVKESMEEPSAKVNVLLQSYISRLKLEGFALVADMVFITQSASRIMRALFEICLKRGWAVVASKALNLCKMIDHRMWGCQTPLRQFKNLPVDALKRLEQKDFSWDRLFDLKPHEIGEFLRVPKLGKPMYVAVHQLPRLELSGHVQPITREVLRVQLNIQPDFQFDEAIHGDAEPFWITVTDVDGETILHYEYFLLKRQYATEEHTLVFTIPLCDPLPPQYYVHATSDRWQGSQTVLPIAFRHLILPEKFHPPTELLDLQPLPVLALGDSPFLDNLRGFKYFNAIQTQTYQALSKTDDSVLVAAPAGSGKTICAEFAVLRLLQEHEGARCVYVAPTPAIAGERYRDWKKRFEGTMGVPVVSLTGESSTDLKLLKDGVIVIATPEQWDVMSRRWRTRKDVQSVRLVIADELHLIGGPNGHVLEVVLSRMRYMGKEMGAPVRVVALSSSVANAKDLGDWLGVPPRALFNFKPNTRPVPLELQVTGFDVHHADSRLLAMTKPAFSQVINQAGSKPVLLFAPDRRQTRRIAADMCTLAAAEDAPTRFLHLPVADIEPYLAPVKNAALRETLLHGVGFYHEGLSQAEREVVRKLYAAGAIQLVVVEHALCWGLELSAFMVIIMDTQKFHGAEHRYVDYPIPDLLQIMGRAARPLLDDHAKCIVMCHTPRKDFLKKFLYDPIPVESHLDQFLADHMSAEIYAKRITNVQEAVDWLTWTFMYRRLMQNPNYYHMQGVTHRHLSDHLSELVENTMRDLEESKCIAIDNEADPAEVSSLNPGIVASYYYIKYTTVEVFSRTLTAKSKLKALLEILANASEFDTVPVRHHEDRALQALARHLPLKTGNSNFSDPHTKSHILLQAHFSRLQLTADVLADQLAVLPDATRLLQAMVDVISSQGWLTPALAAMECSQMLVQALWDSDSPLMQLPHVTKDIATRCKEAGVEGIFDLMDMEDDARRQLLQLPAHKLDDIARFCNQYPSIEVAFEVEDKKNLRVGEQVVVNVSLDRDLDEEELVSAQHVIAPRYPKEKLEGWWVVLGDPKNNALLAIKRVTLNKQHLDVRLEFEATQAGKQKYMVYLMCDCYMGCDQEHEVSLNIAENDSMDD